MVVPKETNLVSTVIVVVRTAGLWHTEKKYNIHPFAILAMFCFFGSYVFQMIALVLFKDNIELEFEIFSVISFCGMGILKLIYLSVYRRHWLILLHRMNDIEKEQSEKISSMEEYDSDAETDNTQVTAGQITKYTKQFKMSARILYKVYCFTGVVFILSPFIEYSFAVYKEETPESNPHILPSWNPFDNVHFLCYTLTVIIETVAAIYCVYIHIVFDVTVIGVALFIRGQFSSLINQSERIGGKGKICNLSKIRDKRAHSRIIACHKVFIQLVSCINELDGLLKNILGFYFFLATLTLCTVAVRLKLEQMGGMQLVSLLQYMCATLTQLYIYCSYGDDVYHMSSVPVGRGPFGSAIWCLSPKTRREVALLGLSMLKHRRLHAGPFNTVDLPSFIQIVRAAYSCYAVLGSKSST